MIDTEARRIIRDFPLGIVASVTPDGAPAASPKGTFLVLDAHTLAYGDIRSPGTRQNLRATPEAEVVFVDPFRRRGVRIQGTTEIIGKSEPRYSELHPKWRATWGELANRISALVLIKATRVLHIETPPYDDGATEDEMIALYKSKYAELYP